ncbi:MAG: hypothetical protein WD942_08765 [Dehalococcoidia bacterium]
MQRLLVFVTLLSLTFVACNGNDAPGELASPQSAVTTATPMAGTTLPPPVSAEASVSDEEAREIEQWGVMACDAVSAFGDAMLSHIDGVDAASLSFEDRRERAIRINAVVWESAGLAADVLASITPPEGAEAFHEALTDQMVRVSELAERRDAELRTAESVEDIERTNIKVEQLLIETDSQVAITGGALARKFDEAALAIAQCRF